MLLNMKISEGSSERHARDLKDARADRRGRRAENAREEKRVAGLTKEIGVHEKAAEVLRRGRARAEAEGKQDELARLAADEAKMKTEIEGLKYELRGPDRNDYAAKAMEQLHNEGVLTESLGYTPDMAGYSAFKARLEVMNKKINEASSLVEAAESSNSGMLGSLRLRFNGDYKRHKEELARLENEYQTVLSMNDAIEGRISHLIAIEGSPVETAEVVTEKVEPMTEVRESAWFADPIEVQPPSERWHRLGYAAGVAGLGASMLGAWDLVKGAGKGVADGAVKAAKRLALPALVAVGASGAHRSPEELPQVDRVEDATRLTDAERSVRAMVETMPDGTQRITIPNEKGEFEGDRAVVRMEGQSYTADHGTYRFDLANYAGEGDLTPEAQNLLAFDVQHAYSVGIVESLGKLSAQFPDLDPSLAKSVTVPGLDFGDQLASPEGDFRNMDLPLTILRDSSVVEAGVLDGLAAYGVDPSGMEIVYGEAREDRSHMAEIFEIAKGMGLIAELPDEAHEQDVLNKIVTQIRTPKTREVRRAFQGTDAEKIVQLLNDSRGLEGFSLTFPAVEVVQFGAPIEASLDLSQSSNDSEPEIYPVDGITLPTCEAPITAECPIEPQTIEDMITEVTGMQSPEQNIAWRSKQTSEVPDERQSDEPNAEWRVAQTSEVPDERQSAEQNIAWRSAQESRRPTMAEELLEKVAQLREQENPNPYYLDASDAGPKTFRDAKDGMLDLVKLEEHILYWVGSVDAAGKPEALFHHAIGLDAAAKQDILSGIMELMDDSDLPPATARRVETYFDLLTTDVARLKAIPEYAKKNPEFLKELVQMIAADTVDGEIPEFQIDDMEAIITTIARLERNPAEADVTTLRVLQNKLLERITSLEA